MKRRAPDASPGVEDERPAPILPKIEQNQTPDTDTEPDRRPILHTEHAVGAGAPMQMAEAMLERS